MKCQYLHLYQGASGTWSVHSCTAKTTPYVPSLWEVDSYCSTSRCHGCIHGSRRRRRSEHSLAFDGVGATL